MSIIGYEIFLKIQESAIKLNLDQQFAIDINLDPENMGSKTDITPMLY